VLDPVVEGVLQARLFGRAVGTDPPSQLDAYPVTGEERLRGEIPTFPFDHPSVFHTTSIDQFVDALETDDVMRAPRFAPGVLSFALKR